MGKGIIMFDKDVKTNKHVGNSSIHSCVLSEDKMKNVGFAHHVHAW